MGACVWKREARNLVEERVFLRESFCVTVQEIKTPFLPLSSSRHIMSVDLPPSLHKPHVMCMTFWVRSHKRRNEERGEEEEEEKEAAKREEGGLLEATPNAVLPVFAYAY